MAKKALVCSCCGAPLNEENTCVYCGVRYDVSETKHNISGLASMEAFLNAVNHHRPYEPSDFVKETFIPNIGITISNNPRKVGLSNLFFIIIKSNSNSKFTNKISNKNLQFMQFHLQAVQVNL